MRKISYYVIAVVVAGVAITALWVYQRYVKTPEQAFLYFKVDKGDIQEAIKVRGEVVAQKEFELEFPFSGTVDAVYVKGGEAVQSGARLMRLDTKDLDLQVSQLEAVVSQRKADLAKLVTGATAEQIKVSESHLVSAEVGLQEAKTNLVDKIQDAYTKSDDAVRAKSDQLFDSPRSANPALKSVISAGSAVRDELNTARPVLEEMLNAWSASLARISGAQDAASLTAFVKTAKTNAAAVSQFLDTLSQVVTNLTANASLSQATIDSYRTDMSAARTTMSTATAGLISAEEKYNLAVANVTLYEKELALAKAPARSEDIAIATARVKEAQGQLEAVREKVRKSTLTAPTAGKVSEVHYEVGEVFRPGESAISMITDGYKLQSDVSELEIAKVREKDGNVVRIALDAFPNQQFEGKVVSVDAKEVIKTEDKYYRVNMIFDAFGANLRSGMSADATILSTIKTGVLRVPALAIYNDGETKYVKVLKAGLTTAESEDSLERTEVLVGITDGEYVEIRGGVREGQTVVVSAE
ncbi:MAG: HlyD family efflux transporter periplasmic adaptor subunit [Candidatus Paceibacterota bacterium]|jgi:HlyD family secretion protein